MAKSKRADAVMFGFDFQVNAAIVLLLENVCEAESLRLEGNHEDIDIKLEDGTHILAQAKSIRNSSTDFHNVRQRLREALESLSQESKGIDAKQLILITNSPNPFNEDESKRIFWGPPTHREYSDLPTTAQVMINKYLENIHEPLDLDIFSVQTLPFETDNDNERYKYVMEAINNFVGELELNIPGLGKQLLSVWHWSTFNNGTKKDATIRLRKKDIMWPIVVITTNIERCDNDFLELFDSGDYDEIVSRYKEVIDSCCERFEFFTKVIADYKSYEHRGKESAKCCDFALEKWKNYVDEFTIDGIEEDIQQKLTQVVLYNIVRRRRDIDKIKRGTGI